MKHLLYLALAAMTVSAQTPGFAALRVPELFDRWFGSDSFLVDLPARRISALDVEVRKASSVVSPGSIVIRVNGKGVGNLLRRSPSEQGVILSLPASALADRPDPIFDVEENVVEVSAQERTGRLYYQSWILRTTAGRTNAYFAYAGRVSQSDPTGVPPDIALELPLAPPVLDAGASGQVRVKGLISAAAPGLSLQISGQPKPMDSRKASLVFDEVVPIRPDMKQVILGATDARGHQSSVTIPIVRRTPPRRRTRVAGRRYAIVIGVSRFGALPASTGFPAMLPGAAASARTLAATLEKAGFSREDIRVLADEDGSIDQIRAAIMDLKDKAGPSDFVLLFAATRAEADASQPNAQFLAGYGTREKQLRSTALPLDELQTLLNDNIRAGQAMAIFDLGSGSVRDVANNRLLHFFDDQEGRAVLVSGMAGQPADTDLFCSQLVASFGAKADLNGDSILTADETLQHVVESVRTASNGSQIPRFRISAKGEMPALNLPEPRIR